MDPAVALVDAYLQVNGYFTVVEYPVIGSGKDGAYQEITDLDVLAFRFPNAGRWVAAGRGGKSRRLTGPDRALEVPRASTDMIVGEVKEGRAAVNPSARRREVLLAALTRFGCCDAEESQHIVSRLLEVGSARTCAGHTVRMIAFASQPGHVPKGYRFISLGHVVQFLAQHLEHYWRVYRGAQFRHPALGLLMTVHKALQAQPAARTQAQGPRSEPRGK